MSAVKAFSFDAIFYPDASDISKFNTGGQHYA